MQPSRIGGRLEHQRELSEGVGDLRDLQDSTSTNFGPAKPAPFYSLPDGGDAVVERRITSLLDV